MRRRPRGERWGTHVRRSSGVATWRTQWGAVRFDGTCGGGGVGGEEVDGDAVDGFGGEYDEVAVGEELCEAGEAGGGGGEDGGLREGGGGGHGRGPWVGGFWD